MKREEVQKLCAAAMLRYDPAVLDSLAVIGDMMENVVRSELCVFDERRVTGIDGAFRPDEVKAEFTREEMLSGVKHRSGDCAGEYAIVPTVIK